jgi:hypothetical protein
LPDGIFSNKKSQFGKSLDGLLMEDMFTAIWLILRPFGLYCGQLVYFTVIWYFSVLVPMLYQEKSGSPGRPKFDGGSILAARFSQNGDFELK